MYYNTNGLTGEELVKAKYKVMCQTAKIYRHFARGENRSLTPSEVHNRFPQFPLTSIRRAITDLTKLGVLEKTDQRREGEYGQPNYCWKLRTKPVVKNQMDMFSNPGGPEVNC